MTDRETDIPVIKKEMNAYDKNQFQKIKSLSRYLLISYIISIQSFSTKKKAKIEI